MSIDKLSASRLCPGFDVLQREQVRNYAILSFVIFFVIIGLTINTTSLVNAQEQQQHILPKTATGNFTLNIDILGVNSETRSSTISIVGPKGKLLTGNVTIDLFSKAQEDFASESNPVALTVPININSSLLHDGDELKVCITMVNTSKVDCESTVITIYNLEGFPKSVQLEAGGSIEEQIMGLPK